MFRTGRSTTMYSSSLAFILAAFSTWLSVYLHDPAAADFNELYAIQVALNEYAQENTSMNIVTSNAPLREPSMIMAWWYPGEPACSAVAEARALELDVVKPEYFAVREGGYLEFMTVDTYGCNGYSSANTAIARTLADTQFAMVSASYAKDMNAFLLQDEETGQYVKQLVDFAVNENFTGIELDFEDFGGWTPDIYERYKAFVYRLGTALHKNGKELMIDLPAVRSSAEEQWYELRLSELEQLPVDYFVIMGYDYQYDYGVGEPVAPLDWLAEVVLFTKNRIQDDSKIVMGIPSYGYVGNTETQKINILTEAQAKKHPLYSQAVRQPDSKELVATGDSEVLVFQDSVSIQAKIDVVLENGIGKVSIWHLGGNPPFGN